MFRIFRIFTTFATCALAISAIAACSSSSGSGVTSSKKLLDLSVSERDKLCAYGVDVEDGPRTVDCGNNLTVTIEDKAACLSDFDALNAQCQATVGDAEGCFEAFGSNPCSFGGNACAALFSCVITAR